jgi:hypothetical protein
LFSNFHIQKQTSLHHIFFYSWLDILKDQHLVSTLASILINVVQIRTSLHGERRRSFQLFQAWTCFGRGDWMLEKQAEEDEAHWGHLKLTWSCREYQINLHDWAQKFANRKHWERYSVVILPSGWWLISLSLSLPPPPLSVCAYMFMHVSTYIVLFLLWKWCRPIIFIVPSQGKLEWFYICI